MLGHLAIVTYEKVAGAPSALGIVAAEGWCGCLTPPHQDPFRQAD